MFVKQVSVFLENKSGRLAKVTRILGENNINISALSIADTTEYGILRLIVNNPDKAVEVLRKSGFSVRTTDVIGILVDDSPGGLAKVLCYLDENNIDIQYMYAFLGNVGKGKALVIIKVENAKKTVDLLLKSKLCSNAQF
jgi:hypothetical protein